MSKGFLWFCQNTDKVDYVKCSIELAKSIKKFNKENNICVVTDTFSIWATSGISSFAKKIVV